MVSTSGQILNAFLEVFEKRDVSIFEPYLPEDVYYDGKGKYELLRKLKDRVDLYLVEGELPDFFIEQETCNECQKGLPFLEFYHPISEKQLFCYSLKSENGYPSCFSATVYGLKWPVTYDNDLPF